MRSIPFCHASILRKARIPRWRGRTDDTARVVASVCYHFIPHDITSAQRPSPNPHRSRASSSLRVYFSPMAKEEPIQLEGQVTEVLPNATFRVQLTNGHNVLATLGGNMRRFRIRVLQGDRVTIEVSPYDLTRGRIIFRHKT